MMKVKDLVILFSRHTEYFEMKEVQDLLYFFTFTYVYCKYIFVIDF